MAKKGLKTMLLNFNTPKRKSIDVGNREFADVSYQPKTNCISLDLGDKDDEDNSYGVFLTKDEAHKLVNALNDAIWEADKNEHNGYEYF